MNWLRKKLRRWLDNNQLIAKDSGIFGEVEGSRSRLSGDKYVITVYRASNGFVVETVDTATANGNNIRSGNANNGLSLGIAQDYDQLIDAIKVALVRSQLR